MRTLCYRKCWLRCFNNSCCSNHMWRVWLLGSSLSTSFLKLVFIFPKTWRHYCLLLSPDFKSLVLVKLVWPEVQSFAPCLIKLEIHLWISARVFHGWINTFFTASLPHHPQASDVSCSSFKGLTGNQSYNSQFTTELKAVLCTFSYKHVRYLYEHSPR